MLSETSGVYSAQLFISQDPSPWLVCIMWILHNILADSRESYRHISTHIPKQRNILETESKELGPLERANNTNCYP